MVRNRILVVDDELPIRFSLREFLKAQGYETEEADSCQEAERLFLTSRPDAAIVDYMLPDGNALDLLPRLKRVHQEIPLIVLTGHSSIDLAVQAIKKGAEQFLTKPVELPALQVILGRLLEDSRNRQKHLVGKSRQSRRVIDPFIGTSRVIGQLAERARKLLSTESPILIQGETGTGKGVLARWLHQQGPRAEEAFVDLNCAGLSRELLDTELFGHEKGAFTGAASSKVGLFEVAHHGTVSLDEIGDMDPQVQPKLLKVLEEKRFRKLGDVCERTVDIRLIAATHEDLGLLVREKKFRGDLYFRISTLPLYVPPLRERVEDIPLLARHMLKGLAEDLGRSDITLSPDVEDTLKRHSWPGNIRELRNVLERAVLLSEDPILGCEVALLDRPFAGDPTVDDASLTLEEVERRHIERVLRQEHGRVDEAAKRLGLSRSALYERIKKHRFVSPAVPKCHS
jgi:DNA-binding NtrC family response regulator